MADQTLGADSAHVIPLPHQFPPMPAVARILARHPRRRVEAFITVVIDLLDTLDGDADFERTGAEDDFTDHAADGPGCPIADVAEEDDPPGGDIVDMPHDGNEGI